MLIWQPGKRRFVRAAAGMGRRPGAIWPQLYFLLTKNSHWFADNLSSEWECHIIGNGRKNVGNKAGKHTGLVGMAAKMDADFNVHQ